MFLNMVPPIRSRNRAELCSGTPRPCGPANGRWTAESVVWLAVVPVPYCSNLLFEFSLA